jgi:hypothetical protein
VNGVVQAVSLAPRILNVGDYVIKTAEQSGGSALDLNWVSTAFSLGLRLQRRLPGSFKALVRKLNSFEVSFGLCLETRCKARTTLIAHC